MEKSKYKVSGYYPAIPQRIEFNDDDSFKFNFLKKVKVTDYIQSILEEKTDIYEHKVDTDDDYHGYKALLFTSIDNKSSASLTFSQIANLFALTQQTDDDARFKEYLKGCISNNEIDDDSINYIKKQIISQFYYISSRMQADVDLVTIKKFVSSMKQGEVGCNLTKEQLKGLNQKLFVPLKTTKIDFPFLYWLRDKRQLNSTLNNIQNAIVRAGISKKKQIQEVFDAENNDKGINYLYMQAASSVMSMAHASKNDKKIQIGTTCNLPFTDQTDAAKALFKAVDFDDDELRRGDNKFIEGDGKELTNLGKKTCKLLTTLFLNRIQNSPKPIVTIGFPQFFVNKLSNGQKRQYAELYKIALNTALDIYNKTKNKGKKFIVVDGISDNKIKVQKKDGSLIIYAKDRSYPFSIQESTGKGKDVFRFNEVAIYEDGNILLSGDDSEYKYYVNGEESDELPQFANGKTPIYEGNIGDSIILDALGDHLFASGRYCSTSGIDDSQDGCVCSLPEALTSGYSFANPAAIRHFEILIKGVKDVTGLHADKIFGKNRSLSDWERPTMEKSKKQTKISYKDKQIITVGKKENNNSKDEEDKKGEGKNKVDGKPKEAEGDGNDGKNSPEEIVKTYKKQLEDLGLELLKEYMKRNFSNDNSKTYEEALQNFESGTNGAWEIVIYLKKEEKFGDDEDLKLLCGLLNIAKSPKKSKSEKKIENVDEINTILEILDRSTISGGKDIIKNFLKDIQNFKDTSGKDIAKDYKESKLKNNQNAEVTIKQIIQYLKDSGADDHVLKNIDEIDYIKVHEDKEEYDFDISEKFNNFKEVKSFDRLELSIKLKTPEGMYQKHVCEKEGNEIKYSNLFYPAESDDFDSYTKNFWNLIWLKSHPLYDEEVENLVMLMATKDFNNNINRFKPININNNGNNNQKGHYEYLKYPTNDIPIINNNETNESFVLCGITADYSETVEAANKEEAKVEAKEIEEFYFNNILEKLNSLEDDLKDNVILAVPYNNGRGHWFLQIYEYNKGKKNIKHLMNIDSEMDGRQEKQMCGIHTVSAMRELVCCGYNRYKAVYEARQNSGQEGYNFISEINQNTNIKEVDDKIKYKQPVLNNNGNNDNNNADIDQIVNEAIKQLFDDIESNTVKGLFVGFDYIAEFKGTDNLQTLIGKFNNLFLGIEKSADRGLKDKINNKKTEVLKKIENIDDTNSKDLLESVTAIQKALSDISIMAHDDTAGFDGFYKRADSVMGKVFEKILEIVRIENSAINGELLGSLSNDLNVGKKTILDELSKAKQGEGDAAYIDNIKTELSTKQKELQTKINELTAKEQQKKAEEAQTRQQIKTQVGRKIAELAGQLEKKPNQTATGSEATRPATNIINREGEVESAVFDALFDEINQTALTAVDTEGVNTDFNEIKDDVKESLKAKLTGRVEKLKNADDTLKSNAEKLNEVVSNIFVSAKNTTKKVKGIIDSIVSKTDATDEKVAKELIKLNIDKKDIGNKSESLMEEMSNNAIMTGYLCPEDWNEGKCPSDNVKDDVAGPAGTKPVEKEEDNKEQVVALQKLYAVHEIENKPDAVYGDKNKDPMYFGSSETIFEKSEDGKEETKTLILRGNKALGEGKSIRISGIPLWMPYETLIVEMRADFPGVMEGISLKDNKLLDRLGVDSLDIGIYETLGNGEEKKIDRALQPVFGSRIFEISNSFKSFSKVLADQYPKSKSSFIQKVVTGKLKLE